MKTLAKAIFLFSMLLVFQLSVADSGLSKDVPITVTVTVEAEDQISKLSPPEKMRIEKAIKVGTAFMQPYLDGLVCDTQNQYWTEEVGSLVAMDDYNWNEKFCSQEAAYWNGWNQKDRPQVCSHASLISLQLENGDVTMAYQFIQLGTLSNDSVGPKEFKSHGTGNAKTIIVAVGSDDRIYNITPKGWPDEITYERSLHEMQLDVADMENFLKHPVPIVGKTLASVKIKHDRYKKLIKQIEQQAAQVCK